VTRKRKEKRKQKKGIGIENENEITLSAENHIIITITEKIYTAGNLDLTYVSLNLMITV